MTEYNREWKMLRLLSFMERVWGAEVIDNIEFSSMEFIDQIEPRQIEQLLDILEKQYKCLKYKSEPLCKTEDEINTLIQNYLDDGTLEVQNVDIERSRLRQEKIFNVHIEGGFEDVCERAKHGFDCAFKISIQKKPAPTLFINDVPIRKFKNEESYPYKMMKLALSLPNGSTVPVKDLLKEKRGDRGCSQDLSEILQSATVRTVFTKDITNASFKIFHTISKEDLEKDFAFQAMVPEGMSDTIYLAKKIEECRINL